MEPKRWTCADEMLRACAATIDLLADLPVSVSRLTGADLDAVLGLVDRLGALAGAGRFTLAREAREQGLVGSSNAGSLPQWVAERCPSLEARDAGLVAKAVRDLESPTLEPARVAVAEGRLSLAAGCVVAAEMNQLRRLVEPTAEAAVLDGLVSVGEAHGCPGVRQLRPALLARYGLGEELQDLDDRRTGLTMLSSGTDIGGGITEYRMRLTPESRAVVEAAINSLSRPTTADGARDPRTVEQRRGDAVVSVCRRAVALTESDSALSPVGAKATVLLTMDLDDLRTRRRPGTVVGGLDAGTILGPETVRRLLCDGAAVPVVLSAEGEVLHLGRTRRLFTRAQIRALWLRDRHCTFPGCTVPASWTDAHHVRHWVDGGATDLCNAALLCGRHHTVVHRDRLTAVVSPNAVIWDQVPGSYDRAPPAAA